MCLSLYRCHLRLNLICVDYDSILFSKLRQALFNEILIKFTYPIGLIADQHFYDIFLRSFTLRLCQGRTFGYSQRWQLRSNTDRFRGHRCRLLITCMLCTIMLQRDFRKQFVYQKYSSYFVKVWFIFKNSL